MPQSSYVMLNGVANLLDDPAVKIVTTFTDVESDQFRLHTHLYHTFPSEHVSKTIIAMHEYLQVGLNYTHCGTPC